METLKIVAIIIFFENLRNENSLLSLIAPFYNSLLNTNLSQQFEGELFRGQLDFLFSIFHTYISKQD